MKEKLNKYLLKINDYNKNKEKINDIVEKLKKNIIQMSQLKNLIK